LEGAAKHIMKKHLFQRTCSRCLCKCQGF